MRHNPKKQERQSIRLKGYDYRSPGLYFITMCCHKRACLFGEILNGEIQLNNAGMIVRKCWIAIPEHFPNVILHEYVIMPNHVHGIIQLVGANKHSPDTENKHSPARSPSKTVGSVVRGFKIEVTKWMRQHTDIAHVWHRNYYEHIIRSEKAYRNISTYIANNPANWEKDGFYQLNG